MLSDACSQNGRGPAASVHIYRITFGKTNIYIYILIPTSETNPSHSSISSKSANRKLMLVISVSTRPCWSLLGVQKTLARMESA